jgi:hypothetical protein
VEERREAPRAGRVCLNLAAELRLAAESEDGSVPTLHKCARGRRGKLAAVHDEERGSTSPSSPNQAARPCLDLAHREEEAAAGDAEEARRPALLHDGGRDPVAEGGGGRICVAEELPCACASPVLIHAEAPPD